MPVFKLTSPFKCTNCDRLLAIGDSVTAVDLDAMNRGGVLCSNCAPQSSKAVDKPAAVEHLGKETKSKG